MLRPVERSRQEANEMKTAIGMMATAQAFAIEKGVRSVDGKAGYAIAENELIALYSKQGYRIHLKKGGLRTDVIVNHVSSWLHSGRAEKVGNYLFFKLPELEYTYHKPEMDAFTKETGIECFGPWSPEDVDGNQYFDIYTVKHEDGTVEYVYNRPAPNGRPHRCCRQIPCICSQRTRPAIARCARGAMSQSSRGR